MEFVNKITGYVLALVLGAILVGGLLIPTVEGIQTTVGDSVTYTNTSSYAELYVTDDVSGTHTVSMISPNTYMTIDGTDIALSDTTRGYYIISDAVSVIQTGAVAVVLWEDQSIQYNPSWGRTFEITYEDGTVTVDYTSGGDTTTYTYPYTWIGYRVDEGGNYLNMSSSVSVYTTGTKEFIAMGYYSSGDNDTAYAVKDGKVTLYQSTYESNISNSSSALVSNTTDIIYGYPIITVDDETFTPYIWAVQKEIQGHADSGTYYVMFGVIALLGIIMLVVVAANAIRAKY